MHERFRLRARENTGSRRGERNDATGLFARTDRMRVRAVWTYSVEQTTQSDIAAALRIDRPIVVRAEGWLDEPTQTERRLEHAFAAEPAVGVELAQAGEDATAAIHAEVEKPLSHVVWNGMTICLQ